MNKFEVGVSPRSNSVCVVSLNVLGGNDDLSV